MRVKTGFVRKKIHTGIEVCFSDYPLPLSRFMALSNNSSISDVHGKRDWGRNISMAG